MEIKQYVLGFLFSPDLKNVLLIRKDSPVWQAGLLNGIGGTIEPGETEYAAMVREFQEEVGYRHLGWKPFAILEGENESGAYVVHIFVDVERAGLAAPTVSPTIETVEVFPVSHTPDRVPNLAQLIPNAILFAAGWYRQLLALREGPAPKQESALALPQEKKLIL
jgi:8-oxo-dGTP pyrophosphatase MutT (NUDIX family)